MKKNRRIEESDYFISILINKIKFICVISLLFGISFYFYNKIFNQDLKVKITYVVLAKPPGEIFDKYTKYKYSSEKFNNEKPLSEIYFDNFQTLLSSKNNFSNFLNDYVNGNQATVEEIQQMKKNKNSLLSFQEPNTVKKNELKYSLKYPKQFNGPKLLSNYILYTRDKTINDFISNAKNFLEFRNDFLNSNKKYENELELKHNEFLIKNMRKENFKYNPFLDVPTFGVNIESEQKYFFFGVFFGFFLSIIFIFFRSHNLNNK